MELAVADPAAQAAFEQVTEGLDVLDEAGVTLGDVADAKVWLLRLEEVHRRVRAVQVEVVAAIGRAGLHRADGHRSAKTMARHVCRLSNAEATRRTQAGKAMAEMAAVKLAYGLGLIGTDQLDRLVRTWANKRVRAQLVACADDVVMLARHLDYDEFDQRLSEWERLADEDGAGDRAARAHANRNFSMHHDLDGSWFLKGALGSLQGVEMNTILDVFIKDEVQADWTKARAEHGDAATVSDLCRTDAQRRADAMVAMCRAAANGRAAAPGGSQIVTNIVFDAVTFERWCRKAQGDTPPPVEVGLDLRPTDAPEGSTLGYRCSDGDGHRVDRAQAVEAAVFGPIRRVIVDAESVVIDLGRKSRCFTGGAAVAVRLTNTRCYFPGCQVPISGCQIDHLHPWGHHTPNHNHNNNNNHNDDDDDDGDSDGDDGDSGDGTDSEETGGRTEPRNGGGLCGLHNRLKHRLSLQARRHPDGTIHLHHPDGTPYP